MEFCPTCGILLQIEPAGNGRRLRFFCPTCPYFCGVMNKIIKNQHLVSKDSEPVFFGKDVEDLATKTETTCPICNHGEALLWQVQIRIPSEPKTKYYRCCNSNCENVWHVD